MRPRQHLFVRLTVSLTAFLLVLPGARAQQKDAVEQYTSIVVFGDSLSDTGNVATLTAQKYGVAIPGPVVDYTLGRFTDGDDTVPAARNDFGVWVEQLARMLPARPAVRNSLAGGTNYAYGYAFTTPGTTVLPLSVNPPLSVTINNINRQITTYLAKHPKINSHTLFVVWGGANDVLGAKSSTNVSDAAFYELAGIERLVAAGATEFLVPNLPPLGAIPRLNGSPKAATAANEATVLFNRSLAFGLGVLPLLNPARHLVIRQLDIFTLFESVIASPSTYYLTNVTSSARGVPTIDPDTYLFWDDLHPTTRVHNIIAVTALKLLEAPPMKAPAPFVGVAAGR